MILAEKDRAAAERTADEWEDFSCPFRFESAADITALDLNRCPQLAILHEYRAFARQDGTWIVRRKRR